MKWKFVMMGSADRYKEAKTWNGRLQSPHANHVRSGTSPNTHSFPQMPFGDTSGAAAPQPTSVNRQYDGSTTSCNTVGNTYTPDGPGDPLAHILCKDVTVPKFNYSRDSRGLVPFPELTLPVDQKLIDNFRMNYYRDKSDAVCHVGDSIFNFEVERTDWGRGGELPVSRHTRSSKTLRMAFIRHQSKPLQ